MQVYLQGNAPPELLMEVAGPTNPLPHQMSLMCTFGFCVCADLETSQIYSFSLPAHLPASGQDIDPILEYSSSLLRKAPGGTWPLGAWPSVFLLHASWYCPARIGGQT